VTIYYERGNMQYTSTLRLRIALCAFALTVYGGCGPGNENIVATPPSETLIGRPPRPAEDQAKKKDSDQDLFIERQREELRRQAQEIEDLKRQKYHDEYYRSRYRREAPPAAERSGDAFGGY
jgi:NH3-dependent NAD+ synthetase